MACNGRLIFGAHCAACPHTYRPMTSVDLTAAHAAHVKLRHADVSAKPNSIRVRIPAKTEAARA